MDRAYGADRSRRPTLRLIAGGSTGKAELRLYSKRSLLRLLRVTIVLLVVPVFILGSLVLAAAAGGGQFLIHVGLPLMGLCAGMVGLAVALLARGVQRFHNTERSWEKGDPTSAFRPSRAPQPRGRR